MKRAQVPISTVSREQRKHQRREAIVEIATRKFLKNGYGHTTMSAIAAELGGSKSTLWSYFASKEALFAASIDGTTAKFQRALSATLDPAREVRAALEDFVRSFIKWITAPDAIALQRLIISEAERFPEIGRIFHERGPALSRAIVAGYLGEQMHRDRIMRTDPVEAAAMLMGLCSGALPQQILWGVESPTAEKVERETIRIVSQFLMAFGDRDDRLFLRCITA